MCYANSINIDTVDRLTRIKEGLWRAHLVADDLPTHLVILFTASRISERLTATTSGGFSLTHPLWGGDLPPHRGALLRNVQHMLR